MYVPLPRGLDVGMSKALRHQVNRLASENQQTGMRMPQVMKPDFLQPRATVNGGDKVGRVGGRLLSIGD